MIIYTTLVIDNRFVGVQFDITVITLVRSCYDKPTKNDRITSYCNHSANGNS